MNTYARWPSQAFLDGLRPEVGWSIKCAILASYSADLASIGAALLALAGLDNERGSGRKADLAEAVERLRGKVRIIIQRGGLARPRRIPLIAGILDQFLREVPFDERERSWHPKIALVQFAGEDRRALWRLWLGSRNLTSVENRDIGLLLASEEQADSRDISAIPGIGELGRQLAGYAELDGITATRVKSELDRCFWKHPARMHVERIRLTGEGAHDHLPSIPSDTDEVIAVSPFLDGTVVGTIGRWGGSKTKRILLATLPELAKIAAQAAKPLSGFGEHVLAIDAPAPESTEPSMAILADDAVEAANGEAANQEETRLGLHAKILAARKGKKLRLWIGSPNATQRAWTSKNVEVIAELTADASVRDGLMELVGQGKPVASESLATANLSEVDEITERLDRALKEVVGAWSGQLLRAGEIFTIHCERAPHPTDPETTLEAGLLTGGLVVWPRMTAELALGDFRQSLQTEIVQLRLSLGPCHCMWMQRVPVMPPIEPERDHAALARHLGPRAFLEWIAALMDGGTSLGTSDEAWDQGPSRPTAAADAKWLEGGLLSLEAMLACWARSPAAFMRADARLRTYLDPILAQAEQEHAQELPQLREFRNVWATVSSELLKGH
jgi:hypothetical protein